MAKTQQIYFIVDAHNPCKSNKFSKQENQEMVDYLPQLRQFLSVQDPIFCLNPLSYYLT